MKTDPRMSDVERKPRWIQRLGWALPTLERQERRDLVERIEQGSCGGVDYVVMMILSSGLASFGLLQGSSTVIIGAMLVAPLMGPLIGAGLALTQNNAVLFRKALGVSGLGLLIGFGVSLAVGMLNPGFEPSMEVEARGTPDILDLGVAILSGFVAAYAMGRPGVSGTLAGVAIAAALVPPLCVVGIGLTNSRPVIAANSAVLLLTNVVAIILAAGFTFKALGVHRSRQEATAPDWARQALKILVMVAVVLLLPLILNLFKDTRGGQARPLAYPVAAVVRAAAEDFVEQHPGIDLITMGRYSLEPASGMTVLLASDEPLPADFKETLTELIHEVRGREQTVRIIALTELPEIRSGTPSLATDTSKQIDVPK